MHWSVIECKNYGRVSTRRAVCCMNRDELSLCYDRYMFGGIKDTHIEDAERYNHYPMFVTVPTIDRWSINRFSSSCFNLNNEEREVATIPIPALYKELV